MKGCFFISTVLLCLSSTSVNAQIGVGSYSNSYQPTTLANPMFNGGGASGAAGTFSFPHKVLGPDPVLVVGCAMNMYPLPQTVTNITYAGKPLTKAWEQRNTFASGYPITQEWFLIGPPTGDNLITVTHGPSSHGHGVACQAVDLFNVYQGVPGDPLSALDGNASHSGPKLGDGVTGSVTCTMHVPTPGDVIVMFEYSTGYNFSSFFAQPFPLSYTTGRYAAPQNSLVVTPPLPVGMTTEKWTLTGSTLNVEFSVGGLTFRPGT